MRSVKAAWEAYRLEFLADAPPELIDRYKDVFFGGAAVVHFLYNRVSGQSIGKQRNAMRKVDNEIREFQQQAILKHMKGNRENEL